MTVEQMAYFYRELSDSLLELVEGLFSPEWVKKWLYDGGYSTEELEYLGYFDDEEED